MKFIFESTGFLASGSSLVFAASPLASISSVFKSQSTANLPFGLICSQFVVSSLWLWYGRLIGDSFVQFPNAVGMLLSGSQLVLFAVYPATSSAARDKTKRSTSKNRADGGKKDEVSGMAHLLTCVYALLRTLALLIRTATDVVSWPTRAARRLAARVQFFTELFLCSAFSALVVAVSIAIAYFL